MSRVRWSRRRSACSTACATTRGQSTRCPRQCVGVAGVHAAGDCRSRTQAGTLDVRAAAAERAANGDGRTALPGMRIRHADAGMRMQACGCRHADQACGCRHADQACGCRRADAGMRMDAQRFHVQWGGMRMATMIRPMWYHICRRADGQGDGSSHSHSKRGVCAGCVLSVETAWLTDSAQTCAINWLADWLTDSAQTCAITWLAGWLTDSASASAGCLAALPHAPSAAGRLLWCSVLAHVASKRAGKFMAASPAEPCHQPLSPRHLPPSPLPPLVCLVGTHLHRAAGSGPPLTDSEPASEPHNPKLQTPQTCSSAAPYGQRARPTTPNA
eukprot:350372-Chlamydomonas_euryale.AAC.13